MDGSTGRSRIVHGDGTEDHTARGSTSLVSEAADPEAASPLPPQGPSLRSGARQRQDGQASPNCKTPNAESGTHTCPPCPRRTRLDGESTPRHRIRHRTAHKKGRQAVHVLYGLSYLGCKRRAGDGRRADQRPGQRRRRSRRQRRRDGGEEAPPRHRIPRNCSSSVPTRRPGPPMGDALAASFDPETDTATRWCTPGSEMNLIPTVP
jgi:hypothetical protein